MLRAIREIQPKFVVGENVSGLINWNGGMVFDEVQADLEAEGFSVTPFILPACAVNAPHRRDRIWFVAYNNKWSRQEHELCTRGNLPEERFNKTGVITDTYSNGQHCGNGQHEKHTSEGREYALNDFEPIITTDTTSQGREEREQIRGWQDTTEDRTGVDNRLERHGNELDATDTGNEGLQRSKVNGSIGGIGENGNKQFAGRVPPTWDEFPTEPPVRSRNDGISGGLAGITFSKHRQESIKAYGNAVVVPLVYQIFKAIMEFESQLKN